MADRCGRKRTILTREITSHKTRISASHRFAFYNKKCKITRAAYRSAALSMRTGPQSDSFIDLMLIYTSVTNFPIIDQCHVTQLVHCTYIKIYEEIIAGAIELRVRTTMQKRHHPLSAQLDAATALESIIEIADRISSFFFNSNTTEQKLFYAIIRILSLLWKVRLIRIVRGRKNLHTDVQCYMMQFLLLYSQMAR